MKSIHDPILISMLDDDLYKFNMGQVVFHAFPKARVTYQFFNRGGTEFPPNFDKALRGQIQMMSVMMMAEHEARYLKTLPGLRPSYVDWLEMYQFDPNEVSIEQKGGKLSIRISGYWYRTIFWEVRLMAIISELYFRMTGQQADLQSDIRLEEKTNKLEKNCCQWIDFGTRRRFSYHTQSLVVQRMQGRKGFLGTSNVHLGLKHGVPVKGTSAHEMVMGLSALYGARGANLAWLKLWSEHFNGLNGIALTDTFTTDIFLQDFDSYYARLFDGVRQDSGSPFYWGDKMISHYDKLGIKTQSKTAVFSDGLNVDLFIKLTETFRDHFNVIGGIGTNLTNDVGVKPLNMVIKLVTADLGRGICNVVKLSDNDGKHTGDAQEIIQVKRELGFV